MPPRRYSRHRFTEAITNSDGAVLLTDRIPYKFRPLDDNIQHVVGLGDTLQFLAHLYYQGLPRPAGLWWVIGDFQPVPVFDPTVTLVEGSVVWIPSRRTVEELVFDERRFDESEL